MEEPYFIKCESVPESSPNLNTEELLPVIVEKIKVEPDLAFTEECTEEHSLGIVKEELDIQDNFEFVSETKPLKEENKSELPEPGPTQENTFELSPDIHTVDELDPHIKQENNVGDISVFTEECAYPSTVSSQTFPNKLHLKKHDLASSAERLHRCEECNKSFARKGNLRAHMVVHSGERPYICNICHSSFTEKGKLHRHMVVHSKERPYLCDVCNKSFTQKSHFRTHMVVHSAERPYPCSICNRSFIEKGKLRRHMVVHSGERHYHCKECSISFTQKCNLRRHMMIHS